MPSLTGSISFNVAFDFTGTVPAVILSASTTIASIDQPNLIGNFTVTQPDGVPLAGAAGQVAWTGSGYNTITVPLSLASDYTYQKGVYTILFLQHVQAIPTEHLPVAGIWNTCRFHKRLQTDLMCTHLYYNILTAPITA